MYKFAYFLSGACATMSIIDFAMGDILWGFIMLLLGILNFLSAEHKRID